MRLRCIPSRVVLGRGAVVSRDDSEHRGSSALAPPYATDNVLHTGDDLCGGGLPAEIVGSHEQNHVRHTLMGQHVTLEALEPRRTVRRRLKMSRLMVFPPMPSLTIALCAPSFPTRGAALRRRRTASRSSQRSWASTVEHVPSVIESPKAHGAYRWMTRRAQIDRLQPKRAMWLSR